MHFPFLEALEPRIAPAVLVNANTVQFQNTDGDIVTVEVSRGTLSEANFKFDVDDWTGTGLEQVLQSLDLSDKQFRNAHVTVTAADGGLADIGAIFAGDNKLGKITVQGGLAVVEAGGAALIQVGTFGTMDASFFGLTGGDSIIEGKLNKLEVSGDFIGGLFVVGDKAGIGSISIDGTLRAEGGDAPGWISSEGKIGKIALGGIDGSMAEAANQGGVFADGKIGKISIAGSITGGDFENTGVLLATSHLGPVEVGGSILGGEGDLSGSIRTDGNLAKLTVAGSIHGGNGEFSGGVFVEGKLGKTDIAGDLKGGGTLSIEDFESTEEVGDWVGVTKGQILIASGVSSGVISAGHIQTISIGGSLIGGEGENSGRIQSAGGISAIEINGGILGGGSAQLLTETTVWTETPEEGDPVVETITTESYSFGGLRSGSISAEGNIGKFQSGAITGGHGELSASIEALGKIGSVVIDGDLAGGGEVFSVIQTEEYDDANGKPVVEIRQDVIATGRASGLIFSENGINSVSIGGSLIGGAGDFSGSIETNGKLAKLDIMEDVRGGGALTEVTSTSIFFEEIEPEDEEDPPEFIEVEIVQERASITGNSSGSVYVGQGMKSLTIGGALIGGDGDNSGRVESDGFISKVEIGKDGSGNSIAGGGTAVILETIRTENGEDPEIINTKTARSGNFSGALTAISGFGAIQMHGGLSGGEGEDAGTIQAGSMSQPEGVTSQIGKLHIGGDVLGKDSLRSATVIVWAGSMNNAFIDGSIIGGDGTFNALIYANKNMGAIEVAGDILGGGGHFSGRIHAQFGQLGHVTVQGDVIGGSDERSGSIEGGTGIKSIFIGGDLKGGTGEFSGGIRSGDGFTSIDQKGTGIGPIFVGGGIFGGGDSENSKSGFGSGSIFSFEDGISKLVVGKGISGGFGAQSGSVFSFDGGIGSVELGGDLAGSGGFGSGLIYAEGSAKGIHVDGAVLGGDGDLSGRIDIGGDLKTLHVGKGVIGGQAESSGSIFAAGNMKSLFIGGDLKGAEYFLSGSVVVNETIRSAEITGSILGGDSLIPDPVDPDDEDPPPPPQTHYTGAFIAGNIGKLQIGGDIKAGELLHEDSILTNSGVVRTFERIGTLTIEGSLIGNEDVPVLITGAWQVKGGLIQFNNNVAIDKVHIGGDVSHSLIVAGVGLSNNPDNLVPGLNPFAQIKSVHVAGDWHASSIAAGVNPGPDGYGKGDTLIPPNPDWPEVNNIFSRIAKIVIEGQVTGGEPGDQYGFVAGNFGKVSIDGKTFTQPDPGGVIDLTDDGDVTLHRVTKAT